MAGEFFTFVGGDTGPWRVLRVQPVRGPCLDPVARLEIIHDALEPRAGTRWLLRGVTSYERYVQRTERTLLAASQPSLGRPQATCAALILAAFLAAEAVASIVAAPAGTAIWSPLASILLMAPAACLGGWICARSAAGNLRAG